MNSILKKITSISIISQYMGLPKQVYLLTISRLICATGYFVYPFVTLYLSTAEGYGESTIGWFTFMFSMICLPSSVIAGKLADKFSRKRTYLIYMLLTDLFFIITGVMTGQPALIIFLTIAYFFDYSCAPLLNSMIMDVTTPANRQESYSLSTLSLNVGFAISPMIVSLFFNDHPHWIFYGHAIANIIAVIMLIFLLKDTTADRNAQIEAEKALLAAEAKAKGESTGKEESFFHALKRTPLIAFFAVASALLTFTYALYMYMIPLHMKDLFGPDMGTTYYSSLVSVNGLAIIFLTPFLVLFTKKNSPVLNMALTALVYLIGFGSYAFLKNPIIFVVMAAVWSCGESMYFANVSTYVANNAPASHRARFQSFIEIVTKVGSAVGPMSMGAFLLTHTFAQAWLVVIGICTVAVIFFLTLFFWEKKRNAKKAH